MHFSGPCRNRSCTCTSWQNSKRTGMDYPSTMDVRGFEHEDLQLEIWIIGTQGPTSSLSLWKIYKSLRVQRRLDLYTYIHERTWDWLYLIAKVKHKKPTWQHHPLSQIIDVYVHQHRTWDFSNSPWSHGPRLRLGVRWNTSPSRFKACTHGKVPQVCLPFPGKCQVNVGNICKYD